MFYNITDSFQAGLSYMYGSRKNLDGSWGMPTASRRSYSIILTESRPGPEQGHSRTTGSSRTAGGKELPGPLTVNFRTLRL